MQPPFLQKLVDALVHERVRFVVIGGVALNLQGHARTTEDFDVCYARDRENLENLAAALAPLHPRLRGAPPELPFVVDARTLKSGLNFTLTTDAGAIDLLGEVTGLGGYAEADAVADEFELFGHKLLVLSLDGLERTKKAAGRPKDLVDLGSIAELKKRRG
ncbi:MAG: nucleotidyl transferase AbiEii/AbiGii toxin family protein [Myxococcales bacterium]|nr:nucleotidyl transferase AbiEii/AbiGii toxin family protein [Myxococcales bacterium]